MIAAVAGGVGYSEWEPTERSVPAPPLSGVHGVISFDALMKTEPFIHKGRTVTWRIAPGLAKFLDDTVRPGHATLETGSGLSTLVITRRRPTRHISIAPDPGEFEAIRELLAAHEVDATPLEEVVGRSQDYLPTAHLPPLDLVLIDGDHSFPAPFMDWYFTADRLKVGGLMIVDDIDIVTGTMLVDFMRADPKWEEILRPPLERYAVYRKVRHPIHDDIWMQQPYLKDAYRTRALKILRRSDRRDGPISLIERIMARILPWRLIQVPLRRRFDWPRS